MLDLIIRGGTVIDGTGAPGQHADVGVADGRIVTIGSVTDTARRTIDATDRIVAPGFVDVHTHIDAQAFWDPMLTPSSWHGVTSMIAGNCGFTLSPLSPDASDYLIRMLSVVEGMPLRALQAGVPCDWTTTAQYLDRLDGTLALNTGFSVGHSAMRRVVMGAAATQRPATGTEVAAMTALLRDGLAAGALGFSSSWGIAHSDAEGDAVPSRQASLEELVALASVCGEFDGTTLEFIPKGGDAFGADDRAVLGAMSAGARRRLNWNVLRIDAATAERARVQVTGWGADEQVTALHMPIPSRARFSFETGFVLEMIPGWAEIFRLPVAQRCRALADPEVRARLANAEPGRFAELADWGNRIVAEVFAPELKQLTGARVDQIAAERGVSPLEALLDIAVADDLRTTFSRPQADPSAADWAAAVELWDSPGVVIGGSDTGAHLDFTANFDYAVYVLEHAVRRHRALPIEAAIHHLTQSPARLYGLRDRGVLALGHWADVVIFDAEAVACGPLGTRFDLPTGAGRLYAEPVGIETVIVNGTPIIEHASATGAVPGRVLRSGRDTTSG